MRLRSHSIVWSSGPCLAHVQSGIGCSHLSTCMWYCRCESVCSVQGASSNASARLFQGLQAHRAILDKDLQPLGVICFRILLAGMQKFQKLLWSQRVPPPSMQKFQHVSAAWNLQQQVILMYSRSTIAMPINRKIVSDRKSTHHLAASLWSDKSIPTSGVSPSLSRDLSSTYWENRVENLAAGSENL